MGWWLSYAVLYQPVLNVFAWPTFLARLLGCQGLGFRWCCLAVFHDRHVEINVDRVAACNLMFRCIHVGAPQSSASVKYVFKLYVKAPAGVLTALLQEGCTHAHAP